LSRTKTASGPRFGAVTVEDGRPAREQVVAGRPHVTRTLPLSGRLRAGCEWKSVIGYSRFDDIKDLAIGNRYAVLMGKPFE
jgi:hypothetical protein